jgi:hypothetical protein
VLVLPVPHELGIWEEGGDCEAYVKIFEIVALLSNVHPARQRGY